MCIVCETTARTHYKFLQSRNLMDHVPEPILSLLGENIYKELMKGSIEMAKSIDLRYKENNNAALPILKTEMSQCSITAEAKAIRFASTLFHHEGIRASIEMAKEYEILRAALTLIQSKAVISGDDAIKKIAEDALSTGSDVSSSSELKKMLEDFEKEHFKN